MSSESDTGTALGKIALFVAIIGIVAGVVSGVIPEITEVEDAWFFQQSAVKIFGVAGVIAVILGFFSRSAPAGRLALKIGAAMVIVAVAALMMLAGLQSTGSDPS